MPKMTVLIQRLMLLLWLLAGDSAGDSSKDVYCHEGETQLLQEKLTEMTYNICMYAQGQINRRDARSCLWEIQMPRDQNGGLLLQMRHRKRPVYVGNDSMANLTATLYRNGIKTMEFQWNVTLYKYIWLNWTDSLKLGFTVDNASATMRVDNSLYLFASFATRKSCSDGSQLHYNGACYLVHRLNSSLATSIPVELAAGASFETVDELLGFFRRVLALGLLKTDPMLLIPGMRFCNGTLMRLISTDADADGGQCQWYPMEGNISSVKWATDMTQSSCCKVLALQRSTEQPAEAAVLRCVTSDEAASQLPVMLVVSSSERSRLAMLPAPPPPHNTSVDCGSALAPGTVPPDSGSGNSDNAKLNFTLAAVVVGSVMALIVVVVVLAIVRHYRRTERHSSTHTTSNGSVNGARNGVESSANGASGANGVEESVPLRYL